MYDEVAAGVTLIGFVVAPVDQAYVAAPAAVNIAGAPGQIVGELAVVTGIGLTVIVYVLVGPTHPAKVGVIVIVEVIGLEVALVAVKVGVFVAPLIAKPIAALELVHVYVAPAGVLKKVLTGTIAPAQTEIFVSGVTIALGLT